jgi:hypothetical protein
MEILLTTPHMLPLWFLIFSLFLPRVTLAVAWLQGVLVPFHLIGWVPLIIAVLIPRILILVLIYRDQGLSIWFLIHVIALVIVWGGSGTHHYRRNFGDTD